MLQFMSPEQQAKKMEVFNAEYAYAIKSQQHLWVAVQSHVLTPSALKNISDGPVLMDNESLRFVGIGCYICEETFDESRQLTRKCKGEPT